ncbi:hypothetical protein [Microbacterium sp. LWS13-1.2]|uniref:Uncharacterized protein n=1 Tax=Microbacterium sp. LWS13-1.2 TaxID=3135264 RepID=A0AAU6SFT1_9MICO
MWLKRERTEDTRSPEYRRLAELIGQGRYLPQHLPELDALIAQEYGPAFALRGALLIQRGESQARDPVTVRLAAGYWLTGAADYDDGASKVLYDEFESEKMGKLVDFDLEYVVSMFLRSEAFTKNQDPDPRRFMIGVADHLGHTDYADELSRRP